LQKLLTFVRYVATHEGYLTAKCVTEPRMLGRAAQVLRDWPHQFSRFLLRLSAEKPFTAQQLADSNLESLHEMVRDRVKARYESRQSRACEEDAQERMRQADESELFVQWFMDYLDDVRSGSRR
jgi:hypothetical protein